MASLIWALGSMLLIMLILYFLPFGLTNKGRIIVVLTGFLMTLAGLAATVSFAIWQVLLLLVILIGFTTYILDKRLGSILYGESASEQADDDPDDVQPSQSVTAANDINKVSHETGMTPVAVNFLKEDQMEQPQPETEQKEDISAAETMDDDISFLLNRSQNFEKEEINRPNETENKTNYLSEIEELLKDDEESIDKAEVPKPQEIIEEIPMISMDDKPAENKDKGVEKTDQPDTEAAYQIDSIEEIPVLSTTEKGGKKVDEK